MGSLNDELRGDILTFETNYGNSRFPLLRWVQTLISRIRQRKMMQWHGW